MIKFSELLVAITLLAITSLLPLHAQLNSSAASEAICSDGKCNSEIKSLHRMARYGSFEAMTLLSMVYATGDGREADPVKALSYLKRAANFHHPLAVFLLSEWYREGVVVAQDRQKADTLLNEAVKLKHPLAQYKKALQLLQQPDDANVAESIMLLEQASSKRLVDAMYLLARLKQQGLYAAKDLEGAAQLFKNLVLSGHEQSRPYLREVIAALAPKPEAAELVADLQQSYDIEVIHVLGRDFTPDTMLTNVVTQLQRTGLYQSGSMHRIKTKRCDGTSSCYSVTPRAGDRDISQTLSGR